MNTGGYRDTPAVSHLFMGCDTTYLVLKTKNSPVKEALRLLLCLVHKAYRWISKVFS